MIITGENRTDPPLAGEEAATVLAFLDFHRDTLRWKCSGLTAEQLGATLPPTTMSLGGLLKHLAVVELGWLQQTFAGREMPSWFADLDDSDPDWSFRSAAHASPDQLFGWFEQSVSVCDEVVRDALARPEGLDALSDEVLADGQRFSLRWILVHLVEEYARHNGHADLIRESIDGLRGE